MKKSILKLGLMVFFGMATVVALNSCSGGEKAVDQTEEAAADSADEGKKSEEAKSEETETEATE